VAHRAPRSGEMRAVCRRALSAILVLAGLALRGGWAAQGQIDLPGPPPPFPASDQPQAAPRLLIVGQKAGGASAGPEMPGPEHEPSSLPMPAVPPQRPALPPAFRLLHPPHSPLPTPPPGAVKQIKAEVQGPLLPALSLEERGPDTVQAGQPATYEILVRNVGPALATGLRVEDDLPAGAQLLETDPAAAVLGSHLTWTLEALGPGQEKHYRVTILPAAGGELVSRAIVSLSLAAAAAQTRVLAPCLNVQLQAPDSATVGQKVDFKIRLLSVTGQPVHGVKLLVRLPEGLQHPAGKVIACDPFDISGEAVKDIDLHLQAVRPGRQVVEAVATAMGQQVRGEAEITVAKAAAAARPGQGLALRKKGSALPILGEKYDYEIWVENRSPNEISNVYLYDRLPEGLTFKAAGQGGTYEETSRTVRWRLGTLQPGQRRVVSLRLQAQLVGEQSNPVWATGEPGQEAHLTAHMQVNSRGTTPANRNR
jgi:uncharacterized repeat protein (TIGR01451 family)